MTASAAISSMQIIVRRPMGFTQNLVFEGANLCHNVAMLLYRIFMLVAGAMVALSIFFVFRPHRPLSGIQPPHHTLAGTGCVAPPETSAIPPKYSCEKPYNLPRKVLFRPRH
jgi:hypothetical protein